MSRVLIKKEVYDEVMYYVNNKDFEVSGLGRVVYHENGDVEVVKAYLLKQEGSSAMTDLDPEAVAELMYTSREDEGHLNWWWHSHVKMGVFMSGTDVATIKQIGKRGHFFATVFNQKDELHSAYYQGANNGMPAVYVNDIDTSVLEETNPELEAKWAANLKDKVSKTKWSLPKLNGGHISNGSWNKHFNDIENHYGRESINPNKRKTRKDGNFLKNPDNAGFEARQHQYTDAQYASMLDQYIKNAVDYAMWAECCSEFEGIDATELSYKTMWDFYELWDGNLEEAQLMLINTVADKDLPLVETVIGGNYHV